MILNKVDSSNIDAIGYDKETKTLFVAYKTGVVYKYFDVPAEVYQKFLDAPSKGHFMNTEIKNIYSFVKQTPLN